MAQSTKSLLAAKERELSLMHSLSRIINQPKDLEQMLHDVSKLMMEQLSADSALIYIFDDSHEKLVLRGAHNPHPNQLGRISLKLGEGITGWVGEHRKRVTISKNASEDPRFKLFNNLREDKFEAFLSIPIAVKDELVGVLNVQHRKAHAHTESELEIAETISKGIAGALEREQALDQASKRAKQIEALSKMSQSIVQGIYLREILQLIVRMTAEMMGSKICSLMLLDEKGRELKIEATQSLSEEYKSKPPIKVGVSVSGRAIQEKRPIVVLDVTKDPQYNYPDIAQKEGLRSLLIVPMITKEKAIGVINCYTTKVHSFSPEEIQLLQAVASQAAIAIEHTRALETAIAAQEALETRKLVERAKGILMRQHGLTEEAAFRLIQRQAMDRRKSMKDVAEAVILSEEIQQKKY